MADHPLDALLFGAIGSLVHCSELQWRHFNQALREKFEAGDLACDLSPTSKSSAVEWDRESYVASLTVTGGKKRMKEFFEKKQISAPREGTTLEQVIADIHARKSELFVKHIEREADKDGSGAGSFQLRPGVLALLKAAKAAGVKTAFVTTTVEGVMRAFVDCLGLAELLDLTVSEKDLPKWGGAGKPDPDCYLYAVQQLAAADGDKKPARVLAVEDTWISLQSPLAAGPDAIPATLVLPSEWSVDQDFSQATLRVAELTDLAAADEGEALLKRLGQVVDEAMCR